jgi:SpoIVB peptidase S55
MKHSWIHVAAALSALLVLALPAAGGKEAQMPTPDSGVTDALFRDAQPIISVSEVKRGQTGYGLTVFAGTEPERFDVEVIGVIRNMNPNVSFILARLTGNGLEKSGVARGMSGSPVYIDGRLAGAVAFSWPFPNEAVAGITPIEVMRQLSGLRPAPPAVTTPPPVKMADLLAGREPKELLERQLGSLQSRFLNGATPSLQWAASGFGERSQGLLRQFLGNVGPSGKALPGDAADDLVPGGAVAAVLVDGDLSMAAYGTVTDRYGDQVLAFGHPFLGFGPIRVPMATAEVVTLFSSQADSFKISNAGQIIGAFEQDRLAGIQGRIGAEAPMVPMVLRVKGETVHDYNVRLADFPEFMPLLVGSTVLAGLEAASYSQGAQGIDLVARLKLREHGDLEIRQSFDSDNAGTEAAVHILSIVDYLVRNPLEQVGLESVEVEVEQAAKPRAADLVGAHADRTVVRPGERVNLNLDLVPYRGERFRHSLAVDLPEDLPAGRYSLLVGDGASADAARLSLEPAEPVSMHQALERLRSFHSRRELVVLGVYAGAGLSVGGEVMPRLPGSVRSLWSAAGSGSAVPLRTTIAQQEREPLNVPVSGLVRIDLEVRRREPVEGDKAGPPARPGGNGGAAETAKAPAASGEKGRS